MKKRVSISRRKPIEEPEIIVIPMIDVMMFLLFFFMVASLAMAVQAGLPVTLPKASSGKDEPTETVTITLRPNGEVYLNTRRTTIPALESGLEALHVTAKNLVTMNVDLNVPYGSVVSAMDQARLAGVTSFAFSVKK
jgi:biopolymer transport protein ExbD